MSATPIVKLNDNGQMPQLGLGVWQMANAETGGLVVEAVKRGYRLIDTAALYGNERGVGEGVRACGVARDELFVTTKLWNDRQGYDSALTAFDRSLERLGLDAVDLYLIHWPAPARDLYVESWKALIRLRDEGRARSIGVSNFRPQDLKRIVEDTGVTPAVNQIELQPYFQQGALRALHAQMGLVTEAWSPLGQGQALADPVIGAIAAKHGRSSAQVILRWHMQLGVVAIPKSASPTRIAENIAVFDFALDADDMARIAALDRPNGRTGLDPSAFS